VLKLSLIFVSAARPRLFSCAQLAQPSKVVVLLSIGSPVAAASHEFDIETCVLDRKQAFYHVNDRLDVFLEWKTDCASRGTSSSQTMLQDI